MKKATKSADIRSSGPQGAKCPARPNESGRSAMYNYTDMRSETVYLKEGFGARLSELRLAKGVSAREMSLSLGQGAGYINNIENGGNLPSMGMFFEICEYLEVSPAEFFGYGEGFLPSEAVSGVTRLTTALTKLRPEDAQLLIGLAEALIRSERRNG